MCLPSIVPTQKTFVGPLQGLIKQSPGGHPARPHRCPAGSLSLSWAVSDANFLLRLEPVPAASAQDAPPLHGGLAVRLSGWCPQEASPGPLQGCFLQAVGLSVSYHVLSGECGTVGDFAGGGAAGNTAVNSGGRGAAGGGRSGGLPAPPQPR